MATQGRQDPQVNVVVPQRTEVEHCPGYSKKLYIGNHHIGLQCIVFVVVVMGTLFILNTFLLTRTHALFWPFVALLIIVTVSCCYGGISKNRKVNIEYDTLPLDHPDRITYGEMQAINPPTQQQSGASNIPSGTYSQRPSGEGYKPSIAYTGPPPRPSSQPSPGGNIQPSSGGHHPSASGGYIHPSSGGYKPSIAYTGPPPRPSSQSSQEGYNQPHGNYNQNPSATYDVQPFDYTGPPPGPYNIQPFDYTGPPPPPYIQPFDYTAPPSGPNNQPPPEAEDPQTPYNYQKT